MINLKGLGERLRSERERLGLSRLEMAELAGLNRTTQLRYESDAYSPSLEFLGSVEAAGADVQYIISGQSAADRAKMLGYSIALVDDLIKQHQLHLSEDARGWLVSRFIEQLQVRTGKRTSKPPVTLSSVLEMLACRNES